MKGFKVYSSSAGSGKTYTLTKEYLKLALRDQPELKNAFEPSQFKHTLAVTFTNAAASDMKDRILKELQKIATNDPSSMLDVIAEELDMESDMLQIRATSAFHAILHDYSAFAVQTIDSFVQRVVTSFTEELNLPYSFEVEMDTDTVLQTAIDRLLEKIGRQDYHLLSDALQAFYLEKVADGKSWHNLSDILLDFSRTQLNDRNYELVEKLNLLGPNDFRLIREKILHSIRRMEETLRQLAQEGYRLIQEYGLSDNAFYGRSGIAVYFRKRAVEPGFPDEPNSYVRKAVDEDIWYVTGKRRLPEHDAIDAIKDQLSTLVFQIEQARINFRTRYLTLTAVEQHLQKVALLKHIKQECNELLREQNRLHISDFNRLIVSIVSNEPIPFLYERLGEKYHHILIDEFQDTSRLQFINLLPLLDNNLAYNRFNMAVGDSKQAIYRFRGGDMDQIVALHSGNLDVLLDAHAQNELTLERLLSLRPHLESNRLTTNWRSAESIVLFNNSFFRFLATSFAETEFDQITQVFDEAFEQQVPAHKIGTKGHVQIDFIEKPDPRQGSDPLAATIAAPESDYDQQMAERTLHLIQQALTDGYRYGEIAVLCRLKRNAQRLATFLEAHAIPLTSEDSLTLQSSGSVQFLVALLQFVYQPTNRLVRYELLFHFNQLVQADSSDYNLAEHLNLLAKLECPEELFRQITPIDQEPLNPIALQQLNTYELVEQLSTYYHLFDDCRESVYLFRFLDEVLIYTHQHSSHLSDFLTYWETAKEKLSVSTPTGHEAVTIQTIHKSKGLEYPVVIIPFADWSSKPRNSDMMWADLSPLNNMEELYSEESPRQEIRRLPATSISLHPFLIDTPLASQYRDELYRTFIECMNLLYVAFTRPTDRLYILSAKRSYHGKEGTLKNTCAIDYWLYAYLNDLRGDCRWNDNQRSYPLHDYLTQPNRPKKDQQEPSETVSILYRPSLRLRQNQKQIRYPSDLEKNQKWGKNLCAALSLVDSLDSVDKVVHQLVRIGRLQASDKIKVQVSIKLIIKQLELTHFFTKEVRAENNRSILLKNSQRTGPNRVVYLPNRVVLLYYFEGTPNDQHQMKARQITSLYRKMGHSQIETLLIYVEQPEIISWLNNE